MNSSNSSIRYVKWSIYFPIVFLHTLIQGWSYRASSTSIRVSWLIGTNLFCVTALFYRIASRTTLYLTLPEGFHPVKLDRSRDFKHKATHTLGTSVLPVTIVNLGLQCLVCMKHRKSLWSARCVGMLLNTSPGHLHRAIRSMRTYFISRNEFVMSS